MSSPGAAERLRSEASCPICLELFRDPVSIPCGHNFCRACIERCWASPPGPWACPRCRAPVTERDLRPSRELAAVAAAVRGLLREPRCGRHRQPLRLFCRHERALLCRACRRSRRHRRHRVLPAEQAAAEYREQIQSCIRTLREERKKFLEEQKCGEESSAALERARAEAVAAVAALRESRRLLEQRERLLLARVAAVAAAAGRARDAAVAAVAAELAQLDTLEWELEGRWQQPASRVLQDIPQLLDSCERLRFRAPRSDSPELRSSLEELERRSGRVRAALSTCQDSLMFLLQEPAELRLDPQTAHPRLLVSADGREARALPLARDVPEHPGRFDLEPCVLAGVGFTSGRHFWELEVGPGGVWAVGVLRESCGRRGRLSPGPERGLWALEVFHSLSSPRARHPLRPPPRRLRVALDYEGRRVAFFGHGEDSPILEHTGADFNGERVLPWFRLGLGAPPGGEGAAAPLDWLGFGVSLRLCP